MRVEEERPERMEDKGEQKEILGVMNVFIILTVVTVSWVHIYVNSYKLGTLNMYRLLHINYNRYTYQEHHQAALDLKSIMMLVTNRIRELENN